MFNVLNDKTQVAACVLGRHTLCTNIRYKHSGPGDSIVTVITHRDHHHRFSIENQIYVGVAARTLEELCEQMENSASYLEIE